MKIKTNFVTNSSSCSFVMIGWHIKKSDIKNFDKFIEKLEVDYPELYTGDEDMGAENGCFLIGKHIGDIDNDEPDFIQINFEDLLNDNDLERFNQEFGSLGPIKLIGSVRLC